MKNTSPEKQRILFIVPLPPPYAGPEVSSEILINSVLREKCDIICLPNRINKSNDRKGKITFLTIGKLLGLLGRMVSIIISKRPSIVYTILTQNVSGFMRDSFLVIVAKIFRKRIVLHFRGSTFNNFYNSRNLLFKRYIRLILHWTDTVILQAQWVKDEVFKPFVPEEKLCVIYNAIPDHMLQNAEFPKTPQSPNGSVTVLYLNHLSVAKGFLVLLEAAKQVVSRTQNINFVIAGDIIARERNIFADRHGKQIVFEDMRGAMESVKNDENLSGRIQFPGEITDIKTKLRLLQTSDIFTLPSYSEGLPLSVLEAMAVGLPVVVTPVGGLVDIIKDGQNGFFVPTGDADKLRDKIIALADNPDLRKYMGNNNASLVREKMTVDIIASRLHDVFKRLEDKEEKHFNENHALKV